jgi:beta-N-acetylhexosaminidase
MKKLIQLCVLIFWCTILVCGCSQKKDNRSAEERKAARWAEKTLEGLSVERKVAQLICTDISGVYVPDDDQKFQSWIKLAGEYGIGGFVLYKGTPYNVAILLNRLQKEANIPLLISADFEGGAGQQITGASEFPGNMGFAASGDSLLMYKAAKVMAEEGRAMGIHLSYTPVSDITLSPENPQESVRSFGGDIDLMSRMVHAYVKGFHEMGMLTTAKHFPGRGDMKPYSAYPKFNYLDKSAAELEEKEFLAFRNSIDAGVDFIMTEHLAVPAVTDGSELPASVEPRLIKGVIREKLRFKGIITTDDLLYDHVVARFGAEEVAIKAIEAGHDVVLKPKDPVAAIKAITEAVNSGRISMEQIDQSVFKMLYYKALLGLNKNRYVDETKVGEHVGTVAHKSVVTEVAEKSITLLKNDNVLPIKDINESSIVNIIVQKIENQAGTDELAQKMSSAFNGAQSFKLTPSTGKKEYEIINTAIDRSDLIILSFFVQRERYVTATPFRENDLAFINKIIERNPGAVVAMSYGNPYIINKIKSVPVFLLGYGEGGWYGNQTIYFDAFIKILKGELSPSGKLPVSVNSGLSIGFGLTF